MLRGKEDWLPVISVDNSIQADLVREMLYEAYIDSIVSVDGRATTSPFSRPFEGDFVVLVPAAQLEAAKSLLDESYGSVWDDSQSWLFDSDQG